MLELINNKVWMYFVKNPTRSIHIRELARTIALSPPTVLFQARYLLKRKLLVAKKEGKNLILSVNYENDDFVEKKKWSNLFLLLESKLFEKGVIQSDTIILFGSYSRGEDTERSDIDIAIEKSIPINNLEKYEDFLNRKLQFHYLDTLKNETVRENVRQGILIRGALI